MLCKTLTILSLLGLLLSVGLWGVSYFNFVCWPSGDRGSFVEISSGGVGCGLRSFSAAPIPLALTRRTLDTMKGGKMEKLKEAKPHFKTAADMEPKNIEYVRAHRNA